MDVRLSDRLLALASLVPHGAAVADIGTDHAMLPVHLVRTGRIAFAIASDIAQGPCDSARRTVDQYGLGAVISVRMGPGLTTVKPGEVDTVVIAGMGGTTAVQILEESEQVVERLLRLIVQPMNATDALRSYLYERGYSIEAERVVAEDGRLYDVLAADTSKQKVMRDPLYRPYVDSEVAMACALMFGPSLLTDPSEEVIQSVSRTRDRWRRISREMASSMDAKTQCRRKRLKEQLIWVEAWLTNARMVAERSDSHDAVES